VKPELDGVTGSPLWQAVFISFAVVLILFEVVRGWRLGLIRQLVRIAALIVAYAAAVFGGRLLVPIVRPFLKMPDIVLSILAGAVLALVIYALVTSLGMVLFKRTGQENSQRVHLIYAFAGAIVGLFFGAFALWLIVASVRAIGAVADAQIRSQARSEAGQSATLHALDVQRRFLSEPNPRSAALTTSLARLKNSLELGLLGTAVKQTDPVPLKTYETLGKVGSVFSNPERAQKFLTFPQNQRIIDAANDPTLADRIKKFDLPKALDHAIQK
jgi:hypothetical protein